jgi:hypothetical protein
VPNAAPERAVKPGQARPASAELSRPRPAQPSPAQPSPARLSWPCPAFPRFSLCLPCRDEKGPESAIATDNIGKATAVRRAAGVGLPATPRRLRKLRRFRISVDSTDSPYSANSIDGAELAVSADSADPADPADAASLRSAVKPIPQPHIRVVRRPETRDARHHSPDTTPERTARTVAGAPGNMASAILVIRSPVPA